MVRIPLRSLQPMLVGACTSWINRSALYIHTSHHVLYCSSAATEHSSKSSDLLKSVMRIVPQPVVVVTTASKSGDACVKRGITCSSFTSISFHPPIISFSIKRPSRIHDLMLETKRFAVHVLTKNQVQYGIHFAKPAIDGTDQFDNISHEMDQTGTPIIRDTAGVILCNYHSSFGIGDHDVWYGDVEHAYLNNTVQQRLEPLLYYARSFRSIGDEAFIKAFEDTTLPFEDWTHEAHMRMAFHYVQEYGCEKATPLIKNGIKNYNKQNVDKISRGYHETVTNFYIKMITFAISRRQGCYEAFDDFIADNKWLLDRNLLFEYYSDEKINQEAAKSEFLLPDKKPFPV